MDALIVATFFVTSSMAFRVLKRGDGVSSGDPLWSNMVERGTPQVPLIVPVRTCMGIVQRKRQKLHTSPFGILVDRSEKNLSHSQMKRVVFPMIKRVAIRGDGFQNRC